MAMSLFQTLTMVATVVSLAIWVFSVYTWNETVTVMAQFTKSSSRVFLYVMLLYGILWFGYFTYFLYSFMPLAKGG